MRRNIIHEPANGRRGFEQFSQCSSRMECRRRIAYNYFADWDMHGFKRNAEVNVFGEKELVMEWRVKRMKMVDHL